MGAAVVPVIQWGAALLAAGSAVHQAQTQSNYNEYLSNQAQADARAEAGAAQVEAERIRKAAKKQRAEAVAALAASGVDVNSSTALRIDQDITRDSEEDAQLGILGGQYRGRVLGAEAQGYRSAASRARGAGYVGAGTSLLQGFSKAAPGWKRPAGGR